MQSNVGKINVKMEAKEFPIQLFLRLLFKLIFLYIKLCKCNLSGFIKERVYSEQSSKKRSKCLIYRIKYNTQTEKMEKEYFHQKNKLK